MPTRDRTWLRRFLRLGAAPVSPPMAHSEVERQEDTVLETLDRLAREPGVLIADEVGMGKTYEAIGVIACLVHENPKAKIAVLTPGPDLVHKWKTEFDQFSNPQGTLFDFGSNVSVAGSLGEFIANSRNHQVVIGSRTMFDSTRASRDKAWMLSLFGHWRKLHGSTVNAIIDRVDGQRLWREDPTRSAFLGQFGYEQVAPHLHDMFEFKRDETGFPSLGTLYDEHGLGAFEMDGDHAASVFWAINLARYRLVRALLPSFDLLVVDEAHRLKNPGAVQVIAVNTTFRKKLDRVLFLTATPFQLHVDELRQIFKTFQLARSAPADFPAGVDQLLSNIQQYQEVYDEFQSAWQRMDEAGATEFTEYFHRSPGLSDEPPPALKPVADRLRVLIDLKDNAVEPGLRRWMVRSLKLNKSDYRRHEPRREQPRGIDAIPFMIYERQLAGMFAAGDSTHKAAAQINIASSYAAARSGRLAADDAPELSAEVEPYRQLLRGVLRHIQGDADHPKVRAVVDDALSAAERGEKTLVFCSRLKTVSALADELERVWLNHVLARWTTVFPAATREEVFGSDSTRRGRQTQMQARFGRSQDRLVLALHEPFLSTHPLLVAVVASRREDVVKRANALLKEVRVGASASERFDWWLAKAVIEAAATTLVDQRTARHDRILAELQRSHLAGAELDVGESSEHSRSTAPRWKVTGETVDAVAGSPQRLWARLSDALASLADSPVRHSLVEQLASYLTAKEVLFLPQLLSFAAAQGLDPMQLESEQLVSIVDRFWDTGEGTVWLKLLREFIKGLASQPPERQREIIEESIQRVRFARQGSDQKVRKRVQAAFNTPLYPMVLVASEVMQEGIDLHTYCSRLVHHDLTWNPAGLEQRVGRIDRINSLTARRRAGEELDGKMLVAYPMVTRTIDERIFRVVKTREKWLQFLLGGRPKFDEYSEELGPRLPDSVADRLRIDLRPRPRVGTVRS